MTAPPTSLLVTGASGALGTALRARLDRDGATSASFASGPGARAGALGPNDVAIDLTETGRLQELILERSPEVIVHLAAIVGGPCEADPARATAVNTDAVAAIGEAASAAGVSRIVFASTAAVYGDKGTRPYREDSPLAGDSVYGRSKALAEAALARAAADSPSLSVVSLRIFNIFGGSFANSLVSRLRRSRPDDPVEVRGMDGFVRDYVHAEDVIDAILVSAHAPLAERSPVFNIGSGIPTSNRALLAQLRERGPVWVIPGDEATSYSCADISRAREILGFDPRRGVND